jgi:O-antigen ligase
MYIYYQLKKHSALKVLTRFILILGILAVGVFAVNPIFKWRVASMFDIQDDSISSNKEQGIKMRNKLWSSSVEVFKDNWLIGVGTGDFKDELERVYKKYNYRIQYRHHMNSHNQYLSYAVSNGLVGLIIFTFYIGYCVTTFVRGKNLLSLFLTLTILMCFMTESHLYTNKGVIVVAFFLTLLSKYAQDTKEIGLNEKG